MMDVERSECTAEKSPGDVSLLPPDSGCCSQAATPLLSGAPLTVCLHPDVPKNLTAAGGVDSCGSVDSDGASSLIDIKISYDLTPFSSTMSSLHPVCRICQNGGGKNNVLITPCRCDGTLKYVHGTCLRKWIEMRLRRKKYELPENCELCGYLYRKRKYIKCTKWRLPKVSNKDKILHGIFLLCITIMIACTAITVQHLITDATSGGSHHYRLLNGEKNHLSLTELITLACGITFFVTFMMAVAVEIKARHTIYEIIKRVIRHNTVWIIENYSPRLDRRK